MKKCNRNEIETDVRILNMPSCAVWCSDGEFISSPLTYDGNGDGTPDNVVSNGSTITITPTDLSFHECDNQVTYVLQNAISGVSLNETTAAITIDCAIASQESCNLTMLIDTICNDTVIGTRSMNIILTCGDCEEDENTQLNYDGNGDETPDNVVIDGDIITITPVDLSVGECADEVRYHISDPTFGISIDEITGVVSIDCTRVNTDNCNLELVIDVNCFDTNTSQTTFMYTTVLMYTLPCDGCQQDVTELDYDSNNDGTPDTVTVDGDIITVTPVELSVGECDSTVSYEFAENYGSGITLDSMTGIVTFDCNQMVKEQCGMEVVVNTMCEGTLVTHATFNAPTESCAICNVNNTELDYDANGDGTPDNIVIDNGTVTVTPVELTTDACLQGRKTYKILNIPPRGVSIDPDTAVISIDCSRILADDCMLNLTIGAMCIEFGGAILGQLSETDVTINLADVGCTECASDVTELDYDSNNDGAPDTVTVDGNIITVTPVELSVGECDSTVSYEFAEDYGSGITLDSITGIVTFDCNQMVKEQCGMEVVVNTMCEGAIVTTATFNAPTEPCKVCRTATNNTDLDYDGNSDGNPDTVSVDGDIVTITPVELSTGNCPNPVTYAFYEDYGDAFTIDAVTGVVSMDCTKLIVGDCNKQIIVNTLCDNTVVGGTAIFNAPTDSCAICNGNTTDLDYDANGDGTPDTITIDGNVITVTPVELATGNCTDGNITYELANPVAGVTIDENTGVISIDCTQVTANVCTLDLNINTICTPN